MKLIGVISDTHMDWPEPSWAEQVSQRLRGVDLVLHAGDITSLAVLDALAPLEVIGVAGNMDPAPVSASLPAKRVIEVEGCKIGLIHGWGAPGGLAERVRAEFQGVDCIVFGHSHKPFNQMLDGVLMFNPGSAQHGFRGSGTVGLLYVDRRIEARIMDL